MLGKYFVSTALTLPQPLKDSAICIMFNKYVTRQRYSQINLVAVGREKNPAKFVKARGNIAELTAGPRGRHLQPAGG